MSVVPSSTPFTVPGFNGANNATPEGFLTFLRSLRDDFLGDQKLLKSATADKDAWVTVVDGLTDHMLGPFPSPDVVAWVTMKEKIIVTEATLEVIKRVFVRVEGIFSNSEKVLKKLFVRLVDLRRILEVWTQTENTCDKDMFTPLEMKDRTCTVLTSILRGLGNSNPLTSVTPEPSWKVLKGILQESLDVCNGKL